MYYAENKSTLVPFSLGYQNMSISEEYIVRYHHEGKLEEVGGPEYENGKVDEFGVDPDKICYWDLLGDI